MITNLLKLDLLQGLTKNALILTLQIRIHGNQY